MGGDVGAKNGDGDVEIAWDSSEVGADTEIEYVPLVRVEGGGYMLTRVEHPSSTNMGGGYITQNIPHRDTRRQTKSRLKTFSSSLQRSSGNPRVAVLGEMLRKNLNVSNIFCGSFSLFIVLHFFAISSICMHSQHSQIQLPNHHTTIIQSYHIQTIIPKSYQNHSNLETYVYMRWYLMRFLENASRFSQRGGGTEQTLLPKERRRGGGGGYY